MTKTAKINARRQRFALEEPVETSDGAGGASRQYRCVAHVWGTLEALGISASASRDMAERRELADALSAHDPAAELWRRIASEGILPTFGTNF